MIVDQARVNRSASAHEREDRLDAPPLRDGPRCHACPRMHQGVHGAREEAVVDEDVLLDVDGGVASLQVAGSIALDAMP